MVSHSEITTYLDCQKKWELQYVKGLKVDNIHLQFGSMGHKVLETRVIPDESLYPELKEAFNIKSWFRYFSKIFSDLDTLMQDYKILYKEYKVENDIIKGVIDAVWKNKETGKILITDYKFSTGTKGLEDILLDEQMYIYAVLYATLNNLSLDDIDIGYINIPKYEPGEPRVLKNGQLSKDKAQCVLYGDYIKAIQDRGLNIADYEDFLSEIKNKGFVQIAISPINIDMAKQIMINIDNTIKDMQKGYVLEKCSYMCKHCDFIEYCKYGKEIKHD